MKPILYNNKNPADQYPLGSFVSPTSSPPLRFLSSYWLSWWLAGLITFFHQQITSEQHSFYSGQNIFLIFYWKFACAINNSIQSLYIIDFCHFLTSPFFQYNILLCKYILSCPNRLVKTLSCFINTFLS